MRTIRLGAGAGYSGDRIEPAVELADVYAIEFVQWSTAADGDSETVVAVDPHRIRARRQVEVSKNFGGRVVRELGQPGAVRVVR